jgi:hypothetical protein
MTSKNELSSWLAQTERIIHWVIANMPSDRLFENPPHSRHPHADKGFKTYFGEWPALRHLYHLVFYEETYAIPTIRYWIGGSHPTVDLIFPQSELEEAEWRNQIITTIVIEPLLERLHNLREAQLEIIQAIKEEDWQVEKVQTGLGSVSAEFVVAKTIQHSLEHANELMKNTLSWERALDWLDRQQE